MREVPLTHVLPASAWLALTSCWPWARLIWVVWFILLIFTLFDKCVLYLFIGLTQVMCFGWRAEHKPQFLAALTSCVDLIHVIVMCSPVLIVCSWLWEGALSPWARLARRRTLEFSRQVCLVKIYTTNIILFAGGLCVSAWCVSVMLPHCSCSQRPWPLSSRLTSRLDSRLTLRSCSSLLSSGKIGRIVFTPLSCLRVFAPTTR